MSWKELWCYINIQFSSLMKPLCCFSLTVAFSPHFQQKWDFFRQKFYKQWKYFSYFEKVGVNLQQSTTMKSLVLNLLSKCEVSRFCYSAVIDLVKTRHASDDWWWLRIFYHSNKRLLLVASSCRWKAFENKLLEALIRKLSLVLT